MSRQHNYHCSIRHERATEEEPYIVPVGLLNEGITEWDVLSKDRTKKYVMKSETEDCTCTTRCDDCNVCVHNYSCTCPDAVNGNICKHIHALCISFDERELGEPTLRPTAIDNIIVAQINRREELLIARHQRAVIENPRVTAEDSLGGGVFGWSVLSKDQTQEYTVHFETGNCACNVRCSACNACSHNYSCSCPDGESENMCKHIHAVCLASRVHVPGLGDEAGGTD